MNPNASIFGAPKQLYNMVLLVSSSGCGAFSVFYGTVASSSAEAICFHVRQMPISNSRILENSSYVCAPYGFACVFAT